MKLAQAVDAYSLLIIEAEEFELFSVKTAVYGNRLLLRHYQRIKWIVA